MTPPFLVTYRTTILVHLSKKFDQLIALAFVERVRPTLELLELHTGLTRRRRAP
jgi:hypothetical protein